MREATDLSISAGVRRDLSGRRVDLSKLKFPVKSGHVTLQGELAFVGMDKNPEETAIELKFIESSLKGIAGVKQVSFELENWKKSEAGVWESPSASGAKSSGPVIAGDGISCPDCDYVIRFCPCCGKPLSGEGAHYKAKGSRPIPPIKPIARKKRPMPPIKIKPVTPIPEPTEGEPKNAAPFTSPKPLKPVISRPVPEKPEPVDSEIKPVKFPSPAFEKPEVENKITPMPPVADLKPAAPVAPVAPVAPAMPVAPVAPEAPAAPIDSKPPEMSFDDLPEMAAPVAPAAPAMPVAPEAPAAPIDSKPPEMSFDDLPEMAAPVAPVAPAMPVAPEAPVAPIDSKPPEMSFDDLPEMAAPVAPAAPAMPVAPEAPAAPIDSKPPEMSFDDLPEMAAPVAPVAPAMPVAPEAPAAPIDSKPPEMSFDDLPEMAAPVAPAAPAMPAAPEAPAAPINQAPAIDFGEVSGLSSSENFNQPQSPFDFGGLTDDDDTPLPPMKAPAPGATSATPPSNQAPASDPFNLGSWEEDDDDTPLPPMKPAAPPPLKQTQSNDPFASLFSDNDDSSTPSFNQPQSADPFSNLNLDLDVLEVFPGGDNQNSSSEPFQQKPQSPTDSSIPGSDNGFFDLDAPLPDDKSKDKKDKDPFSLDDFDISKFKI